MAQAFVSVILEQLASVLRQQVEQELWLVVGVEREVANLTRNFEGIKAVLEDAEERQVREASVNLWLDNLKEVSYELDDVLDEWKSELLKQQLKKQENANANARVTKKKVCSLVPYPYVSCFCFGQVSRVILHHIANKIIELNERLTSIADVRRNYNFQYTRRGTEQLEREKSSSFVDTTYGRVDEKEILLNKLLGESSQSRMNPLIIPVIGMGGIGKTTIAQLAYNDEKVSAHFSNRIWVCVSEPFDEIKIAKAIIEGLKGNDSTPASNELQTLLQLIHDSIKSKKFLLVLDDVWTEDYRKWEQLKLSLQSGALGSKVLVTTRKEQVAMMMRATDDMIHLERLSDEHCWSLFHHIALADRERNESKLFEDIGKKIVEKCKGLPLVAKTLGGLMRYKKTRKEWEEVLISKIWELDVIEQQVFRPLLLSYYDLAPPVKRCLLYCLIFPKGKVMNKDNLIELWMSQDYLHSNENKEKKMVGESYFNNLVWRSLFQDLKEDELGNVKSCKVHDIVHDFLEFLTQNEYFIMESTGGNERVKLPGDKVRYMTLSFAPEGPFPVTSFNCKNLRALHTFNSKITSFGPELILQLKCLRTLNLSYNSIKELSEEVGGLVHLRYLDLSWNIHLKKLPDALCNLLNLQTLKLESCIQLDKLPEGIGKLINLQHLHVVRCRRLRLPKGIAGLTSLQTLDSVYTHGDDLRNTDQLQGSLVISNEAIFKLSDLRNMDQLQGSLVISNLHGDASEAEKARLVNKKHLLSLRLDFLFSGGRADEEVLNALKPHPNLESLGIVQYCGTTLMPSWLMSLNNLRILDFTFCICEFLPPLGKLGSLESLKVFCVHSVKKVGVEFLGIEEDRLEKQQATLSLNSSSSSPSSSSSSLVLFPKLKTLHFDSMLSWEEWEGMAGWSEEEDSRIITIMPSLSTLYIAVCPRLKTLPNFLPNTPLKSLTIFESQILTQSCNERGGPEWHKISRIPNYLH